MGRMIDLLDRLKKKPRVILIKEVKGILKTKQTKLLSRSLLNGKKAKSERKEKLQETRQVMKLSLMMS
jgi:hypothetical protein